MKRMLNVAMLIVCGILFTLLGAIFEREKLAKKGISRNDMVIESLLGRGFDKLITVDGKLVRITPDTKDGGFFYVLTAIKVDGETFTPAKRTPVDFFTSDIGEDALSVESNNLVRVIGYETFSASGAPCSIAEYVDVPQMTGGWGVTQRFVIVKILPFVD